MREELLPKAQYKNFEEREELKNYGYKPVIDRVNLDVNPGMYTSAGPNANGQRMIMYTVEGNYSLKLNKAPALAAFSPEPI